MRRTVSIFHPFFEPLTRSLAAALLPQDCFLCGAHAGPSLLCASCEAQLPRLTAERCPVCALPSPSGAVCGACLKDPPHYDATVAIFAYGFPLDRVIQALKYGGQLAAIPLLGNALAGHPPLAADLIVPLPLHARRLKERGFNQALEIARMLATRWRLPLDFMACERSHDAVPQVSLPWSERKRNVRGTFSCHTSLKEKHIAAVDDVMTTGATLDEFARTLKKAGAARVTNLVVARTLK
jgi:ComF family protein